VSLAKTEIETQEDLRSAANEVAVLMLEERNRKNAMDAALQAVRDIHEPSLARLACEIEVRTEMCAEYCTQHPDLMPNGAKSIDLGQSVIGFRTGTPKVKLLRRWTAAAALTAVKARKWFELVRTIEELDKEAVIARRVDLGDALASVGLSVVQEETFYIQPKLEEQPSGVKLGTEAK
jgi:phage host-nuclease inhibitor protein Gam